MQRLVVEWADAVAENFAPRAMKGFGLDYDTLAAIKPDLVMMSACLNGQTGPHKDYPGFGGQGSALAGYNALTGWPDREPVGPYGTITDSLAPRYVATALAAGLALPPAHRAAACTSTCRRSSRRSGRSRRGCSTTRSTASSACATATTIATRVLHGAFACADEDGIGDRWVTIACWTDDELGRARASPESTTPRSRPSRRQARRRDRALITRGRRRVARRGERAAGRGHRSGAGRATSATCTTIPQLAHRGHFEPHTHPFLGPGLYERNGFRLSACPSGYDRAGPTLGQDNEWVLARGARSEPTTEIEALRDDGRGGVSYAPCRRLPGCRCGEWPDDREWIARGDHRRVRARRGSSSHGRVHEDASALDGFVVENDGRPIGCALWLEIDGDAELVVIVTTYRGAGAGTALLDAVVDARREPRSGSDSG